MKATISRPTLIAAYALAICTDFVQICLAPILGEGFASPFNDFLDVVVCLILTLMIGFHIAFLPSFLVKLIPVENMIPTWTLAVLIATRNHLRATDANGTPKPDVIIDDAKPPKILPEKRD